jgi:hypothetical protein
VYFSNPLLRNFGSVFFSREAERRINYATDKTSSNTLVIHCLHTLLLPPLHRLCRHATQLTGMYGVLQDMQAMVDLRMQKRNRSQSNAF